MHTTDTSARVTPVSLLNVDPTEVRKLDDLVATFPPTSEVGQAVRDVLQGITWGQRWPIHRDVTVTVTRAETKDTGAAAWVLLLAVPGLLLALLVAVKVAAVLSTVPAVAGQ